MAEFSNYIEQESRRYNGALSGSELMTGSRLGAAKSWSVQQMANVASQLVEVDTSGDIELEFDSGCSRKFVGSSTFATPKAVSLVGDENANHFTFIFEITNVAAVLDFGAGSTFISGDSRFTSADQKFTPDDIGKFKITADFDGTNWLLDFNTLPYS